MKMRYAIPSALVTMAAVGVFLVRGISKVINRKQKGHILPCTDYCYSG